MSISHSRVNSFHVGQVWESPRHMLYKVIDVKRGEMAVLRLGEDGSGRKIVRNWDSVVNWVLYKDQA